MPHYADGTPAVAGDTVRGKGYNIRGEDGELAEITGTLLRVDPNAQACNVQVAVIECYDLPDDATTDDLARRRGRGEWTDFNDLRGARMRVEYGQADHFTKV